MIFCSFCWLCNNLTRQLLIPHKFPTHYLFIYFLFICLFSLKLLPIPTAMPPPFSNLQLISFFSFLPTNSALSLQLFFFLWVFKFGILGRFEFTFPFKVSWKFLMFYICSFGIACHMFDKNPYRLDMWSFHMIFFFSHDW